MKRRRTVAPSELPPFWFDCWVEDWVDDGDVITAFRRWLDARSAWAAERGARVSDFPQPLAFGPKSRKDVRASSAPDPV